MSKRSDIERELKYARHDVEARISKERIIDWLKEPAWGGLALSLWLFMSPFICGYSDNQGAWTIQIVFMMMGAPLAIVGTAHPAPGLIFMAIFGPFLIIAPWGIGYGLNSAAAGINSVVVGLLFMLVGWMTYKSHPWSSLDPAPARNESDPSID